MAMATIVKLGFPSPSLWFVYARREDGRQGQARLHTWLATCAFQIPLKECWVLKMSSSSNKKFHKAPPL